MIPTEPIGSMPRPPALMPRDVARGLEAGFFHYLTKPIKAPEFMTTLDVALAFSNAGPRDELERNKS